MTRHVTMPNFLVIGAAKAGTTSLYHYLVQHPQVFLPPVKEPRFFAYEGEALHFKAADGREPRINTNSITQLNDYQALFARAGSQIAIGDVSPIYLYSGKAPRNIRRHLPDVRLIALLRNPVDRAFSNYVYMRMRGMEPCDSFEEALEAEQRRIADNWAPLYHYRHRGFYHAQLSAYYELFQPGQIGIWLFEDFRDQPLRICREIFGFLGIDTDFIVDTDRDRNASGVPKSLVMHSVLGSALGSSMPKIALVRALIPKQLRTRIRNGLERAHRNNLTRPTFSLTTRVQLKEDYRDDIVKVQSLVKRDLSAWLS